MSTIKAALISVALTIWIWMYDVWSETKTFGLNVWDHVKSFFTHLYGACAHAVMIPVRWVQWIWGCLKACGRAFKKKQRQQ